MPKSNHNKSQVNQYDKVVRENMEAALPGIIEHLLGLNIVYSEELPDDVQHTKERRPDLLKRVTDSAGEKYVLHIEYQAQNDMDMAYRMAEYSIMLQWKYRLEVKQYVIYIGMGKSRMPENIATEDFQFRYRVLALSAVDYKLFLNSDKPEEKILAILANFENEGAVSAIRSILLGVKSTAGTDLAEDRYFNQLRVLVQLRNLEEQFDIAMEAITKFFKEERDPLFRRGETKGLEKGLEKGREEGLEIGREEGREEGLEIGRELGFNEGKKQLALEMKRSGLEIGLIANITGFSIEEIEEL